jgi:hypothetical protein
VGEVIIYEAHRREGGRKEILGFQICMEIIDLVIPNVIYSFDNICSYVP